MTSKSESSAQNGSTSKFAMVVQLAPAISAIITAVFVALTGFNIGQQVNQKEIENAFLIREKLTPRLSFKDAAEPFTPAPESQQVAAFRIDVRNELPAMIFFKMAGARFFTCDGEKLDFEIVTKRGTPSEAVVTPVKEKSNQVVRQLHPFSEDTITAYLTSVNGYSREQLALVEEKQVVLAFIYLEYWVEGVKNFREFIFEHSHLLLDDAPSSIDDFSERPFSRTMNWPLVFEVGEGNPRVLLSSRCRRGIDIARGRK